jgi:hypothetical protein
MPHLLRTPLASPESGLWSTYAARDLNVVVSYLRQADTQRRCCAEHSASVLGALISYSRPFTERADRRFEQQPAQRQCYLSLAADLGADLQLHSILLQARDELLALSDIEFSPAAQLSARRFRHPDPRLARVTRTVPLDRFRRLAQTMWLTCGFFEAEWTSRRL